MEDSFEVRRGDKSIDLVELAVDDKDGGVTWGSFCVET